MGRVLALFIGFYALQAYNGLRSAISMVDFEELFVDNSTGARPQLPWQGTRQYQPYGMGEGHPMLMASSKTRGVLGVKLEIKLASWLKSTAITLFLGKITSGIQNGAAEQGIETRIHAASAFTPVGVEDGLAKHKGEDYGGAVHYVLPVMVEVLGIENRRKFSQFQAKSITQGIVRQMTSGVPLPRDVDRATTAAGVEIKSLSVTLAEHPALSKALSQVTIRALPETNNQFEINLEVKKYPIIKSKTGDWSLPAYIAGGIGIEATHRANIISVVYETVGRQVLQGLQENGIMTVITGYGQHEHVKNFGVLAGSDSGFDELGQMFKSLHIDVMPLPIDDGGLVDYANALPASVNDIPEAAWKGSRDGKDVVGFTMVVTVVGVEPSFGQWSTKKLVTVRDGLKSTLGATLKSKLAALSVQAWGCGWRPEIVLAEETPCPECVPPFPHDETMCSDPPQFE